MNLMAWLASWVHRTGENEKKRKERDDNQIKIVGPVLCAEVLTMGHPVIDRSKSLPVF